MKFTSVIAVSATAGLVIPALHFIFHAAGALPTQLDSIWLMCIVWPLWPTSITLIATDGMSTMQALPIIAMSLGANAILYCVPGILIWLGWSKRLHIFKIITVVTATAWITAYCVWLSHAMGWASNQHTALAIPNRHARA